MYQFDAVFDSGMIDARILSKIEEMVDQMEIICRFSGSGFTEQDYLLRQSVVDGILDSYVCNWVYVGSVVWSRSGVVFLMKLKTRMVDLTTHNNLFENIQNNETKDTVTVGKRTSHFSYKLKFNTYKHKGRRREDLKKYYNSN